MNKKRFVIAMLALLTIYAPQKTKAATLRHPEVCHHSTARGMTDLGQTWDSTTKTLLTPASESVPYSIRESMPHTKDPSSEDAHIAEYSEIGGYKYFGFRLQGTEYYLWYNGSQFKFIFGHPDNTCWPFCRRNVSRKIGVTQFMYDIIAYALHESYSFIYRVRKKYPDHEKRTTAVTAFLTKHFEVRRESA